MKLAYYSYGITNVTENENNRNIIDIHFGSSKLPLSIFKKDAYDFLRSIISQVEIRERGLERLLDKINGEEIKVLNYLLEGRAMVLCTDFENYLEYANGGQNGIQKITSIQLDGTFALTDAYDYASRQPGINDLYPSTQN